MKHKLKTRIKHTSMTMKHLLLLSAVGIFFLTGCDIGEFGDGPVTPTANIEDAEGQEVANSENPNQAFAMLPPPVIAEASDTPIPVTNTPEATTTPENTNTPEASEVPPTDTPAPTPPTNTPQPVQPTNPPPPPPPPPTETAEPLPPPPPTGMNGLTASHFALQDRSEYTAGGSVWFEFTISNSTGGEVAYNALGVMPKKDGVDRFEWYQQTYGGKNSTIKPGGLTWEDRIKLPEPGSYTLRLVMCADGFDNCLQGGGTWHTMSQEIGIQIK